MIILYAVSIFNILLIVLLIVGYRKQIKINRWLSERLLETITHNTNAIRNLSDDANNSRTINLNIDSLTKQLIISSKFGISKEEVEHELIRYFSEILKKIIS